MTCGLIMTERPLTAREDDTVADAAARLVEHRYINLPVVDKAGKFLGMFGIYDVFNLVVPKIALAGGLLPNLRFMGDDAEALRARFGEVGGRHVGDMADRDVRVVHPDTPEIEALRLFGQQHSTLAVVARDTRMLLGIVSYWDALCALTGIAKPA
jgi:CBS domain-containing protein